VAGYALSGFLADMGTSTEVEMLFPLGNLPSGWAGFAGHLAKFFRTLRVRGVISLGANVAGAASAVARKAETSVKVFMAKWLTLIRQLLEMDQEMFYGLRTTKRAYIICRGQSLSLYFSL
jgi:hypothetical protein